MPEGILRTTTRTVPKTFEVLGVFLMTVSLSFLVAISVGPYLMGSEYRILVNWVSHFPQLLIPWMWFRWRVAPLLPREERSLIVWPEGSTSLFWKIAVWMVGLKFLASLAEAWYSPTPQWVQSGFLPILLIVLYQGLFVGLSEELMIRLGLHKPLLLRFQRELRIGRVRLSHAGVMSSLLFGVFHLPNALLGQSIGSTLAQVVMAAVVGGIIGYYYERTSNYLGAALLHGMLDGSSYIAFLLVWPFK